LICSLRRDALAVEGAPVTLVVVVVYPPPPPPGHHNDGGDALPAALRQARRGQPHEIGRRGLNPACWLLDEPKASITPEYD
jgi:hypothetical protein